ncbi:hypothetical protein Tco_0435029 [Tanacetum coccineum]
MCALYSRRDTFTPLNKIPKEILAMESVSFPPPPTLVGSLEKQTMSKFWDYHRDRGHNTNDCYHLKRQIEEAVASRKLAHLDGHEKPQDRRFHHLFNDQVSNAKGSGHNANQKDDEEKTGFHIEDGIYYFTQMPKELKNSAATLQRMMILVVLLLEMKMNVRYGYSSIDVIRNVLNHGLSIWTLIEIFLKHLDSLSHHIINLTAEGDLRKFSDIGATIHLWDIIVNGDLQEESAPTGDQSGPSAPFVPKTAKQLAA